MITGGTGSLGTALTKHLQEFGLRKIIIYSRDEFKQSEMAKWSGENVRFLLGDVRDKNRLVQAMQGVDTVIHAAALKQVPATEYNPTEAIKTNIDGSVNVVEACCETGVGRAVLVSTDKAVNPVNLYGSTKLAAEKVFMAANNFNKTSFAAVRYGNVIGSRGSVIPFYSQLAAEGRPLPLTDGRMTRFWITLDQATTLVLFALTELEKSIFVPNLPAMSVKDMGRAIYPQASFKDIGIRAGEKLHESLISEDNEHVIKVVDDDGWKYESWQPKPFTSDQARQLTADEFREML